MQKIHRTCLKAFGFIAFAALGGAGFGAALQAQLASTAHHSSNGSPVVSEDVSWPVGPAPLFATVAMTASVTNAGLAEASTELLSLGPRCLNHAKFLSSAGTGSYWLGLQGADKHVAQVLCVHLPGSGRTQQLPAPVDHALLDVNGRLFEVETLGFSGLVLGDSEDAWMFTAVGAQVEGRPSVGLHVGHVTQPTVSLQVPGGRAPSVAYLLPVGEARARAVPLEPDMVEIIEVDASASNIAGEQPEFAPLDERAPPSEPSSADPLS